jgi:hypothetical protein
MPEARRAAVAAIAACPAMTGRVGAADDTMHAAACLAAMAEHLLLAGSSDPLERAEIAALLRESLGQTAASPGSAYITQSG